MEVLALEEREEELTGADGGVAHAANTDSMAIARDGFRKRWNMGLTLMTG